MGTASRNQSPESISYNGNQTTINNLRNSIAAGEVITASDINDLRGMINSWDNHTHTYKDLYQKATFGNNGDRSTYERNITSNAHDQANANVASVSSGDLITASHHNAMAGVCNDLRSHKHNVNDRTSK